MVACLGKPNEAHLALLQEARRPVVVVLDGDAWEEGEALSLRLRFEGLRAGFVRLPPKTDPDEVSPALVWDWARASL